MSSGARPDFFARYDSPRHSDPRHYISQLPVIESLQFGDRIGAGSFSSVYRGTYQRVHPAAIKIIERGSESTVRKEIEILTTLRGLPHIVQLFEVIEDENTILVFEFVQGLSPEKFMNQVNLARFQIILRQLLEALAAAHGAGVCHRDVKLANLLVPPTWDDVRLIDWGCAAPLSSNQAPNAGTRAYRSIEMLMGFERYRHYGDLWAVGALIYTILCGGDIPWRAGTPIEALEILSEYVGGNRSLEVAGELGVQIPEKVARRFAKKVKRKFSDDFAWGMRRMRDKDLIDLMQGFLALKMQDRTTIEQALAHPFFAKKF
jgi:casein kinase II subunit alpha